MAGGSLGVSLRPESVTRAGHSSAHHLPALIRGCPSPVAALRPPQIAIVFEFTGALVLGRVVQETIAGGIADISAFQTDPEFFACVPSHLSAAAPRLRRHPFAAGGARCASCASLRLLRRASPEAALGAPVAEQDCRRSRQFVACALKDQLLRSVSRRPVLLSHRYGMMWALLVGGVWQIGASSIELNVSATHSIIGAIVGFAMAYKARPSPRSRNDVTQNHSSRPPDFTGPRRGE